VERIRSADMDHSTRQRISRHPRAGICSGVAASRPRPGSRARARSTDRPASLLSPIWERQSSPSSAFDAGVAGSVIVFTRLHVLSYPCRRVLQSSQQVKATGAAQGVSQVEGSLARERSCAGGVPPSLRLHTDAGLLSSSPRSPAISPSKGVLSYWQRTTTFADQVANNPMDPDILLMNMTNSAIEVRAEPIVAEHGSCLRGSRVMPLPWCHCHGASKANEHCALHKVPNSIR
jgi:hypothetical protein